jgi:ketosteroid isomerase-like protein
VSEQNLELVRKGAEAWNHGDWDELFALYHPDAVLDDEMLPDGASFKGRAAIRERFDELRSYGGNWDQELETVLDAGDEVVSITRVRGRLAEDTPPFEGRVGAVLTVRDDLITRIRLFPTPESALAAAGLPSDTDLA